MVFENGVKNIQAAAYNGARTVVVFRIEIKKSEATLRPNLYQGTLSYEN